MEFDRLNSPNSSAITFEVLGHQLQFAQDPNSKHVGTTVWDASMVLAKFLEKNSRKGRFSASKLKGKRVIELGAGCGVAGFGMALLGCDVVSTDQTEVLPLLMRNAERNTSRIMQMNPESGSFGSIQVAELDWGNENHIEAVGPPFDFIIGTDVVYAEHLLEPLLQTMLALSGPRTTILLGYEIRSTNVHEQMLDLWKRYFDVKTVPRGKMDNEYQHPSIQLYILIPKASEERVENTIKAVDQETEEFETDDGIHTTEADTNCVCEAKKRDDSGNCSCVSKARDDVKCYKATGAFSAVLDLQNKQLSDWEARRCGAMAARLLQDIKIT